jgi:hypothetical protein
VTNKGEKLRPELKKKKTAALKELAGKKKVSNGVRPFNSNDQRKRALAQVSAPITQIKKVEE